VSGRTFPLPVEIVACPLCGGRGATRLFEQRDLSLGVPGVYAVARCDDCALLYQNPRVRVDCLGETYPQEYAAHTREPELSRTVRRFGPAVRWTLAAGLGYRHLDTRDVSARHRLSALLHRKRIRKAFPPWIGQGRLLDVGCASGKFLRQMGAVGWRLTGIEYDLEAADKARSTGAEIFVGDPTQARFAEERFDLITAFHSLEHMPDPLAVLTRMMAWLAPEGLAIVEVPNVAGLGARLFGPYWSGFDLPRHLVHFTPATMQAMVERAGGVVARVEHKSKARYFLRSLRHRLGNGGDGWARATRALVANRLGMGVIKLAVELLSPLGEWCRRGEAVRYFIRRRVGGGRG
jgi:2-polyprenyl-3-methyl-5-hydroxy-6-metoxy-1,4-benzoquinol methylase